MSDLSVGDTVRVSFESQVKRVDWGLAVSFAEMDVFLGHLRAPNVTVELVKRALPPEPAVPGTVVLVHKIGSYPEVAIYCALHAGDSSYGWEVSGQDGCVPWALVIADAESVEILRTPGGER